MQFLLLIYENEKRFVSGFDPAEMQEYETFGQQHANASRAVTPSSPLPKRKPYAFEMARR